MSDEQYVRAGELCERHLRDLEMTTGGLDWQERMGLRAELIRHKAMIPGKGKRPTLYLPSVARATIVEWLHERISQGAAA